MNEPPVMISTKDLAYISDMFEWNFTASKVAHDFQEKIENLEVKNLVSKVSMMHSNICRKLISILGGQNEQ